MMWSDKAFTIYMGDAGMDTQFDANPHAADSSDVPSDRMDARVADPCADGTTKSGTTKSGSWRSRSGTKLTDTQLHGAVRG